MCLIIYYCLRFYVSSANTETIGWRLNPMKEYRSDTNFLLWFFAFGMEVRFMLWVYKNKLFPLKPCSAGNQLYKTPCLYSYPAPSIPLHYDFLRTATILRRSSIHILWHCDLYHTWLAQRFLYSMSLKICRSGNYLVTNEF